eukprot:Platyproteum_vivax@DN6873_c0_g1_i3.p1
MDCLQVVDALKVSHIADKARTLDCTNLEVKQTIMRNIAKRLFSTWHMQMLSGASILVYGFGSKRRLLQRFHMACLSKYIVVEVDGASTRAGDLATTIKALLSLFKVAEDTKSMASMLLALSKALSQKTVRLVWLVHSLDSPVLREKQDVFASLASMPRSHLVASVDSLTFPLLWNGHAKRQLNPLFHEAHTYEFYRHEVLAASANVLPQWTSLSGGGQHTQGDGLEYLLMTVTENSKQVLLLLAELFLEKNTPTVSEAELLKKCKAALVATSASKLKSLLENLIDHKCVIRKGDQLSTPYSQAKLKEIIELIQN